MVQALAQAMTTLRIPSPPDSPSATNVRADLLADVALPLPMHRTFAYTVPPSLSAQIRRGCRVAVPFGHRSLVGYVVGFDPRDPPEEMKAIQRIIDETPILNDEMLDLARWIAERTFCSWGEAIRAAIPAHPSPRSERILSLAQSLPIDLFAESAGASLAERILSQLAQTEEISLAGLAKMLGLRIKDLEPHVRALAREKKIRWRERIDSAAARAPRIKIVRLRANAQDGGAARAPVQARCLALLREAGGIMPLRELAAALPGGRAALRRLAEKGALELRFEEWDGTRGEPVLSVPEIALNAEQASAVERIESALEDAARGAVPRIFLLHGVTGSGKTEVYLRAIRAAHRLGKQTIFLVPEITLTPQTVSRLRGRFGGRAAVIHSRLTDAERRRIWNGARRGIYDVVLGPRSAIFAPLPHLGLIVVDEEHDGAYKQQEAPRYVARDVAIERARRAGAVVILGSATPDLETFTRAEEGELEPLRLPVRVSGLEMPGVRIVDLRTASGNFSEELCAAIDSRLSRKEQTILFLNRRGFSPFVQCTSCGAVLRCDSCSVSLTYHKAERILRCHYCDAAAPLAQRCPFCAAQRLVFRGAGTQRIEEELRSYFENIRLARLDSDSVRARGAHEKILGAFLEGEIDVLLGTQMVAKGLDFPRVTLVGVLNADVGLHLPDYRASERTFQLLAQVAGRAGRSELGGEVVIQTRCPEHACFRAVQSHDEEEFRRWQLQERRAMRYPPFAGLAGVLLRGPDLSAVEAEAGVLREQIAEAVLHLPQWAVVLGPAAAPLPQLKGKHRVRILVKAERREDLLAALSPIRDRSKGRADVEVLVDVDPYDML
jgi:primosomal protein N' (replication factor Y)